MKSNAYVGLAPMFS